MACLKNHKTLLQPCLAFLEQYAHFTLTEKALDFTAILLGFNKCINFMKGPNCSGQLVKQSLLLQDKQHTP
jgi:hypothetical protein